MFMSKWYLSFTVINYVVLFKNKKLKTSVPDKNYIYSQKIM